MKQWIAEGRAFVCPRQAPDANTMQLGLAFLDAGVKHRAFIQARYQDFLHEEPPHQLEDCLDLFSEREAVVLRKLVEKLKSVGIPLFVFGSVAWEKVSGASYRTEKSDLDILCDVTTMNDLRFVTEAFSEADYQLPFSIDGEIRFPEGRCVNWLELLAVLDCDAPVEVLVKDEMRVYMSTVRALLEHSYA